jgi:hypothetical protein
MNINKLYFLDFIFTKINEKSSINELSLMVRKTFGHFSLLPTVLGSVVSVVFVLDSVIFVLGSFVSVFGSVVPAVSVLYSVVIEVSLPCSVVFVLGSVVLAVSVLGSVFSLVSVLGLVTVVTVVPILGSFVIVFSVLGSVVGPTNLNNELENCLQSQLPIFFVFLTLINSIEYPNPSKKEVFVPIHLMSE